MFYYTKLISLAAALKYLVGVVGLINVEIQVDGVYCVINHTTLGRKFINKTM